MSGHSHWAGIKHHKGLNDAKRAAVFTKYARLISIAARDGNDPETNFKLRLAIDRARGVNMPKDNVERAIRAGAGELKEGTVIEEVLYEAYGPGHIALLIEGTTTNKNRAVSDIKTILTKNGGKFVSSGAVSFLFRRVGIIVFSSKQYSKEAIEAEAIEAGADDIRFENECILIITQPEDLQKIRRSFEIKQYTPESAELHYIPLQTIALTESEQSRYETLKELLEDHADVQNVWDNKA